MKDQRIGNWYMRERQYPVVEPLSMTAEIAEAFDANPQLFLKTVLRRELVWVGRAWPSPEEMMEGLAEAHRFFTWPPDIVSVPWPSGSTIMGVEVA